MTFGCFEVSIESAIKNIKLSYKAVNYTYDISRNNKYKYVFMQVCDYKKSTIIIMNDIMEQNQIYVNTYSHKNGLFKYEKNKILKYEKNIVDMIQDLKIEENILALK